METLAVSNEALSRLIGLIYDCALDPERWPAALSELQRLLGFANAALSLQAMPSGRVLLHVATGIPPEYLARMHEYGPEIAEGWGGAAKMMSLPLDEPAVLSRVNPATVSPDSTNRYTVEWARPQGLADAMALGLARDAKAVASIGLGRHANAGPIEERHLALARLLVPHLQRALAISRLLDLHAIGHATLSAALDGLAVPTLLVDRGLHLLHANDAGDMLLRDGDPLSRRRDDVLVATVPAVTRALAEAVAQAGDDVTSLGRKGAAIPTWRADGTPTALHVLPLLPMTTKPRKMPDCAAAIFVSSESHGVRSVEDVVAALFDLTAAEARVFTLLAEGASRAEAAEALGVALPTVKTHVAHLYTKLGVRRQSDIVALAASLRMPLAG